MARFLPSWYNFNCLDACRGTNELDNYEAVPLDDRDKCAAVQCRGTNQLEGYETVTLRRNELASKAGIRVPRPVVNIIASRLSRCRNALQKMKVKAVSNFTVFAKLACRQLQKP